MPQTGQRFNVMKKTALPATAGEGIPLFTTDSNELFVGTGPATPIQRINLSAPTTITTVADTTSVQFTNLDINASNGYKLMCSIKAPSAACYYSLFYNGIVTATDYVSIRLDTSVSGTGKSVSTRTVSNAAFAYTAGGTTNKTLVSADVNLIGGIPITFARSTRTEVDDLCDYSVSYTAGLSNVTSITITSSTANGIKAGSVFELRRNT